MMDHSPAGLPIGLIMVLSTCSTLWFVLTCSSSLTDAVFQNHGSGSRSAGKQMVYSERMGRTLISALGASLLTAVLGATLFLAAKFEWFRKKLPAAGAGPENVLEDHHFIFSTWALSDTSSAATETPPVRVKTTFAVWTSPLLSSACMLHARMSFMCVLIAVSLSCTCMLHENLAMGGRGSTSFNNKQSRRVACYS
jgi:hypothetical protein